MSRLPFDPKKAIGAEPVKQPERYSVSQAVDLIKITLETRIPSPIRVIGQVSNLSIRNHWYFSLKDENAVLHCAAWATAVRKFGYTPKDGDEVVASGHISHYPQQGKTQLYVDQLTPVGAGAQSDGHGL
jgi:exodeoxyribonuclease VII large subunit